MLTSAETVALYQTRFYTETPEITAAERTDPLPKLQSGNTPALANSDNGVTHQLDASRVMPARAPSVNMSRGCFPVRRSRIHLRRAAHPEGEVDGRAGRGVEGKERGCVTWVWVLIRERPHERGLQSAGAMVCGRRPNGASLTDVNGASH